MHLTQEWMRHDCRGLHNLLNSFFILATAQATKVGVILAIELELNCVRKCVTGCLLYMHLAVHVRMRTFMGRSSLLFFFFSLVVTLSNINNSLLILLYQALIAHTTVLSNPVTLWARLHWSVWLGRWLYCTSTSIIYTSLKLGFLRLAVMERWPLYSGDR